MSIIVNNQTINRVKRVTDLIEANAKLATPGDWGISHGHVFCSQPKPDAKNVYACTQFDICSQPSGRDHTIYGEHPQGYKYRYADMKHIATCKPERMKTLVADVRELLTEREDPRALVANLINALDVTESGSDGDAQRKLVAALEEFQDTTIPRFDLEAQVRTLGADSLLPPERK